ncbi:hypothetical protein EZV62_008853 [Acer yangbiense]|uniref:Uncharacterized protein n=1 Tax=Acer yangbiense TaxID=1000413 RepID=A0A5C7IEW7_9ROSI|nr:hypothetical protein EZV62_008853 [Acer yangbiense]
MLGAHLPFCQLKLLNRLLKELVISITQDISHDGLAHARMSVDLQFPYYKIILCQEFGFILYVRISGNTILAQQGSGLSSFLSRCCEKQIKEASRLQTMNRKLSAMNKLLMVENDSLQKQVSHLVYENGYMRTQLQSAYATTTDNSCESVVMSVSTNNSKTQHSIPKGMLTT